MATEIFCTLTITNEKTILSLDNPVGGDSLVIEPEMENEVSDLVLAKIQTHSEVTATSNNTTDWGNHTSSHLRTPIKVKSLRHKLQILCLIMKTIVGLTVEGLVLLKRCTPATYQRCIWK